MLDLYNIQISNMRIAKIFLMFFICFIVDNLSFAITKEELKDYKYINFYDFISNYNYRKVNVVSDVNNKKRLNLDSRFVEEYLINPEKYITYLEYRSGSRRVDFNKRPFLLNWLKLSSQSKVSENDNLNFESVLVDQNFDLLFTSTLFSTTGATYYLVTQKTISDSMQNDVKLGETIKVYLFNLGQYSINDIPIFVITGYEKISGIPVDTKNEISFQEYYQTIKKDIYNRNYDKAKGKIESMLKKYPDNKDLKLNLCLVLGQTNYFSESTQCYKDVLKGDPDNYDALYGISSVYYSSSSELSVMTNILYNTNKAINIIDGITSNPSGSLAIVYYNCKYLRAMAKINLKDPTGINDLISINQKIPTLVSSDTIDFYKKLLKIKDSNL